MNSMWSLSQNNNSCYDFLDKSNIPQGIMNILWNRGYSSIESALEYLRPSLFDLHSPFLFKDMQKVIDRLEKALKYKEKVLVYGDYDADGITGTSLLYKVLKNFGFNIIVYIPSREEGYGLHKDVIDKAGSNNVALIITVDCGITAIEETILASTYGIDMIITDHHEPQEILPSALGILNPKVEDSGYPFKYLAGVGVAFKLVQALYSHFDYPQDEVGSEFEYLDLVALGTIADIVPLVGENRILAKYGLQIMENTIHTGLKALLYECGLNEKHLKAGQVSFILAPRINAAGRMDTARLALNLLLEEQYEDALVVAKQLSTENYQRQLTEKEILKEAEQILSLGPMPDVIVLSSPNWNHGVIGIVASRLVERFQRPVYLIAEEGEVGKGSARGIPDYHVLEELIKQDSLLSKYGGHKQAAGFTILIDNIAKFKEGLNISFKESGMSFQQRFNIDAIVPSEDISLSFQRELEQMAPFGAGNPAPLLLTQRLKIKKALTMGKEGEHIKLFLESKSNKLEAVAFKQGKELENIRGIEIIDIIYSLELNEYGGEKKIQAVLKDYRKASGNFLDEVACSTEDLVQNQSTEDRSTDSSLNRQMLVELYKGFKHLIDEDNIFLWNPQNKNELQMIKVFEELGLVRWLGGTDPYLIELTSKEKTDLQSSLRFRMLSEVK